MSWLCTILGVGCVAGTVSGAVYVQDGDTIYVDHQPVRLFGVDAEELDEPQGIAAREHMRELIGNRRVSCEWNGWSYQRRVGICYAGTVNLNRQIIADGYALDCAHYSGGIYRQLEPPDARRRLIQKPYC
jgi:micrococcal nuclease